MIKSKADLAYYLDECRKAYGKPEKLGLKGIIASCLFPDYNYEFMRNLRKLEYWSNRRGGVICRLMRFYRSFRKSSLRARTGIELNVNCAGPGLHVSHGKVVVSAIATLGAHCKILSDVTIGGQGRYDVGGAPQLGDRVWVGSGAKIIGPIRIADGVVIGANAVVAKDILEPNTTWAGIPAKKVSNNGSSMYLREEFRASTA